MIPPSRFRSAIAAAALALLLAPLPAACLTAAEVLVVANGNARESADLAAYYMKRRAVPAGNLLQLRVTEAETCSRKEYDERIAAPVRERLRSEGGKALKAVVLLRGVPLRILPPDLSSDDQARVVLLTLEERQLAAAPSDGGAGGDADKAQREKRRAELRKQIEELRHADEEASVDSELTLVRVARYDLKRWVPNPLYLGAAGQTPSVRPDEVVRVSRLDGPSDAIVRRVIDDSLAAEAQGLRGNAYFDARWKDPGEGKTLSGYDYWDKSIHRAAAALKKLGLTVVLDDKPELFPEGSRLPAALYCGWYALTHYVAAFEWQRGSMGYHIASGECETLRPGKSQAWCKRMLEEGVAATLGPVSEPFVQAFPPPHLFFPLLVEGHLTLAEAYMLSTPYLSWKMVLLGDPLYRPFPRS